MNKFAVISNGVVSNTIVVNSIEEAVELTGLECVSILDGASVTIGSLFNAETGEFNEPPALDPEVLSAPLFVLPEPPAEFARPAEETPAE